MPVLRESNQRGATRILGLICAAVLCSILVAGLWPFHAPQNDVSWIMDNQGLHFGHHGTILSSRMFNLAHEGGNPTASLEIWVTPRDVWHKEATLLAFYAPQDGVHFSLYQAWDDLLVVSDVQTRPRHIRSPSFHLEETFQGGSQRS